MIDVDGVSVLGKIVDTKAKKNEALQISTYVTKPVAVIDFSRCNHNNRKWKCCYREVTLKNSHNESGGCCE